MKFATLTTLASSAAALTVHIVPHTHDDVGWLKNVDQYYSGLNATIQQADVRMILNTVFTSLQKNPSRKFTYVEQAFFQRWWREQDSSLQDQVRELVKNDQLNFVNGGWCMHDEAATHYVAMIDQTTVGHRFLAEEFGPDARPTVGWQLDPFGHSATNAALLSAEVGFDALFFGRIDYQDRAKRIAEKRAEWVWRASPSLGGGAEVFTGLTGSYGGNYGPPDSLNWDVFSQDDVVEDNKELETYNLDSRVNDFVFHAMWQFNHTQGEHIMFTMGSDFQYEDAEHWFANLDKIIKGVNADGRISAQYSSPAEYAAAKMAEQSSGKVTWPLEQGNDSDFFPYADGPHQFWTGYFTSRPALKRYIRSETAFFNAARQAQSLASVRKPASAGAIAELLKQEEALGVSQHHDAVSGTAKQHVTFDYARRLSEGHANTAAVFATALGAGPLAECLRLNETVCPQSQLAGASGVDVLIWNQLGQQRNEVITLPVAGPDVEITNRATGQAVKTQVYAAGETVNNYARDTKEAAYVASFAATLPAVGFASYSLSTNATTANTANTAKTAGLKSHHSAKRAAAGAPGGADAVLENEFLSLTVSGVTGRVSGLRNLKTGTSVTLDQSFCTYTSSVGDKASGQKSGAYIFRPMDNTDCEPVAGSGAVTVTAVIGSKGDLVQEVRQSFSDYLTQTIRLKQGARHAEFEFTIGEVPRPDPHANSTLEQCVSWRQTGNCDPNGPPEPQHDKNCTTVIDGAASGYCECFGGRKANAVGCAHPGFTCKEACMMVTGKEIVSRFASSIASAGRLLTDSNGREMMHRMRDYRPEWKLIQTEPVAGNYFPVNAAAAINDTKAQLTVLVDSSQAGGSIKDGQIELMVHRRLTEDDSRGVGEPLDERSFVYPYVNSAGGMKSGPGLVVRGTHYVSLEPPASAASVWRPLADRVFAGPHISFGALPSSFQGQLGALSTELPANLQLMTLQTLSTSPATLLLRLSHQFGIGEDPSLSQPASVDLAALFSAAAFKVTSATEVSLTNNAPKATILKQKFNWTKTSPHPWRTGSPLHNWSAESSSRAPVVTLGPLEIKAFVIGVE